MKNILLKLKAKFQELKYWFEYKIHQIKHVNFKELIFLDWYAILIFSTIIVLNLLFNLSEVGLPSQFPSLEDSISVLEILVRSIVVLLSIIFSFTLLSFQIFNKYFGRFAFFDFFKKRHLKLMFTLFILNVAFLIYSIGYLKTCHINNNFTTYGKILFLEAVLFSIILCLSIFPVMINLLSESQNRTNLKRLFRSINIDNTMSFTTFFEQEINEEEYHTNVFKIINEIGLSAIKDFDQSSFEIVVRSIYLKSKEVFENDKSLEYKKQLYYNFRNNLKDFFIYAVKEKNSFALSRILTTRLIIEKETIKNKLIQDYQNLYKGWDFNFDIEDFFSKTTQYNEDSTSSEIIDLYRDYFTEIIKNYFPSFLDYDFERPYENMEATNIVSTNYGLIENFIKTTSSTKKPIVLKSICNLFCTIDLIILESKNTVNAKKYLLYVNNFYKQKYLKCLIEDALIKNIEFQYYPFGIAKTSEITKLKSAIILRGQISSIDYLYQKKVLNNLVLNDLKAVAFSIMENLSEDLVLGEKLLTEIIQKFDYLRSLIKKTDNSERKDLYINIHRYLEYIKSGYAEKGIDYNIKDLLNNIILKFEYLNEFKKDLDEEGYLQNKNLF